MGSKERHRHGAPRFPWQISTRYPQDILKSTLPRYPQGIPKIFSQGIPKISSGYPKDKKINNPLNSKPPTPTLPQLKG